MYRPHAILRRALPWGPILVLIGLLLCACTLDQLTAVIETSPPQSNEPVPTQTAPARPSVAPSATSSVPIASPDGGLVEILAANPMLPRDPVALTNDFAPDRAPIPRVVRLTPMDRSVGDVESFWVADLGTGRTREIAATLTVLTEHLQMWVEQGVEVEPNAVERSAQVFERVIRPAVHRYFGTEWIPGVDGDPRTVVLNARFSGASGYMSSANQYSRLVHPYSNECEMVTMNLNHLTPGTEAYDAVLAHEFQHLVHWHQDSNEDAWVNEGASELARHLSGFGMAGSSLEAFRAAPDLQLNAWPDKPGTTRAHYGASYLMMRYLLDRLGPDVVRDIVQEPASGVAGFDAALARDESGLTFDELFADWVVANALSDPTLGDGRYGYSDLFVGVRRERVREYPWTIEDTVSQYGADYFEFYLEAESSLRIEFEGEAKVRLVPNEPASGSFQWWSNRGDSSHAYLERSFDLTGVATATLTYNLWYDIEEGWDYAYVRASVDGGETWLPLEGQHSTDLNPHGNALTLGYTGRSGGAGAAGGAQWVQEAVDLGAYVGREVLVRFDYVTDDAVNRAGMCLDDIALVEIGYLDDAEHDDGGWRAQGFIRHDNRLPQRYLLQLVEYDAEPTVTRLEPWKGDGSKLVGEWEVEIEPANGRPVLLIVSALAPVTTEKAPYRLAVQQVAQARD